MITPGSKTTLYVLVTVVAAAVGATLYVQNTLSRIDARLARIEENSDAKMSTANMKDFAYRLAIENPGTRVPDPSNMANVILIQKGLP